MAPGSAWFAVVWSTAVERTIGLAMSARSTRSGQRLGTVRRLIGDRRVSYYVALGLSGPLEPFLAFMHVD